MEPKELNMKAYVNILGIWNSFVRTFTEYEEYEIISDLIDGEPYFSYKKYGFDEVSFSPENMEDELEFRLENDATMAKKFIHFVIKHPIYVRPIEG